MSRCQEIMIRQLIKKMGKTGLLEYFGPHGNLRGRSVRSTRYYTFRTGAGATHALRGEDRPHPIQHGRAKSTRRRRFRRITGLQAARQRTGKTDQYL